MTLCVACICHKIPNQKFLKSLRFADEIVLITDQKYINEKQTKSIKYKQYYRQLAGDFAAQRNFALRKIRSDWVLFLDDDETIDAKLINEIQEKLVHKPFVGYYLRRLDSYYSQILFHGETGNIRILRLARRRSGRFFRKVHEQWKIVGEVGFLSNPIFHHHRNLVASHLTKIASYGPLDAVELTRENKPFSYLRLIVYPTIKFFRNYFFRFGFLDGYLGLFHAYLMSVQSISNRIYQYQIR